MWRRAPLPVMSAVLAATLLASSPASSRASSSLSCSSPARASPGSPARPSTFRSTRRGVLPGTLPLSVERLQSGPAPSRDAVLALAGGPGQATLPLANTSPSGWPPRSARATCSSYDQRGTGPLDPLSCSALEELPAMPARARRLEECALDSAPFARTSRPRNRSKTSRRCGGGRLRKARALRHLLRHQGRPRLRRALPPARRGARARLRSCRPEARNRSR